MADYAEEKARSEKRDRELGFEIDAVESEIRARIEASSGAAARQTWNHLSAQIFQTPYEELARIIVEVDPEKRVRKWVDLGAAYGRLGIVLGQLRPEARFLGLELVPERVREGRRIFARIGLDPETLVRADLAADPVPSADAYFIYDFGTREEIDRVLESLRAPALEGPIVVVGRGRGVRDAIERGHPWLGAVIPPVHSAHHTIYRSA